MSVTKKYKQKDFPQQESKREKSDAIKLHILRIIYSSGDRWLTTNEIAREANISWNTAIAYLSELFSEGYLKRGKTDGGLTCWKENK